MFYFEDENGVTQNAPALRSREDSISSHGSTSSAKSTSSSRSSETDARASPMTVVDTPSTICSSKPQSAALKISGAANGSVPRTNATTKPSSMSGSPGTKRPKRRADTLNASTFHELYELKGELLGRGAYASVRTCVSKYTGKEYAVKIIDKRPGHSRSRVIKEIQLFTTCAGHPNIVQLIEFFESTTDSI